MKFIISCAAFVRLASVAAFIEPDVEDEIKRQLTCVRIENRGGQSFGIATNQKVASIEYLGQTGESDGVAHVVLDEKLFTQCTNEKPFGSFLEIVTVPEIAFASAKTMMGYTHQGNVCIFPDKTVLDGWRTWAVEPAKKSKGAMFWTVDHVETLMRASPSGKIVFPEFIDVDRPIVVRDTQVDSWVGLFVGKPAPTEPSAAPATLPAWWIA